MKAIQLFFLIFPLLSLGQNKFDAKIEQLQQNNKYEYVYAFVNNYATFRTFDNKMGVVDTLGKVVIKPVFRSIYIKKGLTNLFEVGNEINKKFKRGFVDLKGNIKIPIIYDNVFYVEKQIISVIKDNKYGVLDTLNNVILPIKFDYISFDNDLIIAQSKGAKSLYDFQGKQISTLQFTEISNFTDNRAIVTFQNKSASIIDNEGDIILNSIKNCSFESVLNGEIYLVKDNLNSKKGVVNSKGEFVIKCKYDELKYMKSFFIAKSNNKQGFISITDSIIKPFNYEEIHFSYFGRPYELDLRGYKKGDNFIVKKDNLYGVVNPYIKNDIIPIRYKNISTLFDKYYIVQNSENKNGLFLENGTNVLKDEYQFYNNYDKTIFATENNKHFLISIEDDKFSQTEVFVDEFVKFNDDKEFPKSANQIVKTNGKFGVVNYKNLMVIPCIYELIESIYDTNEFIVRKNNKYGVVNSENKIVENIEYDAFQIIKETISFSKKNNKTKKYHSISFK
jgi:hypothetical protein